MRNGFRLGKIMGITIRVDWSWLFIFLLVTWNLSSLFGQLHAGWGTGMRWGIAVLGALLFFSSVLAHELAHSLIARSKGLPVRNITLFLFGGVSNIQREPTSPGDEFLMAILGPLTSLVLGGIFLGITLASTGMMTTTLSNPTQALEQMGPLATLFLWLGSVNVLLGAFNLIPGFPLDGGRVLRSIFWALSHNLRKATQWATLVGQAVAWAMILAGIAMTFGVQIPLLGTGLADGLWLAFIGWFLHNAAVRSYQRVVVQDVLEDVRVSEMMRKDPPTVPPDCTVDDLVHRHVMGTDDSSFPVIEEGVLIGLVTLSDVRNLPQDRWKVTQVRQIMTSEEALISLSPDTDAGEAFQQLAQHDIRQIPVISNGEVVGLLRRRDILRWLQLQPEVATDLK